MVVLYICYCRLICENGSFCSFRKIDVVSHVTELFF